MAGEPPDRVVDVAYQAPPTVSEFMQSSAFVRCVVGPIGSGKSSGCVMEIIRRAMEQAPGPDRVRRTRFAVVRNTFPQLRDTTRKTFEQWIPSLEPDWWKEQSFTFHFEMEMEDDGTKVDCEVLFRALDRPQDVGKLLSLELTGCYFNELREIAKPIFDGMQGRVGRYPSKREGGPTWFGVWADTNPWHTGHWAHKLFKSQPEGFALFRQPSGLSDEAENTENLPPGYYARLIHGKDEQWIDVYARGKEGTSDKGSVFGEWLDALEQKGLLSVDFAHSREDVFTSWDLGIGDATAIWWWVVNEKGGVDLIDFYANHGKSASHYFGIIRSKPYTYRKHWLPHDARARSFQTGKSTIELTIEEFGAGAVAITPELLVDDGISATRSMMEQKHGLFRIHPRCAEPIRNDSGGEQHPGGVEALREYRFEWDEEKKCFKPKPLHNWASNPADACRYVACAHQNAGILVKPADPPPRVTPKPPQTIDELFQAHMEQRRRR